ncbi:MAG: site-specific integrase [Treponema sp.]|nr:site-specific integrase [Treponema sp.]
MEPIKGLKQIWQKIKEKRKTIYFEDMVEAWLAFKKKSVKESTYYNYIYKIENYLNPIFKGRKIKDFEGYDFEEVVKKFSKKLSNKTLKDIINILKAILKYSEKQYSRKLNVEEVVVPRTSKREVTILSKKEKKKLENYCLQSGTLRDIGILVCLYTGVRVGEICALKWKEIDIDRKMIYIEKTMQRIVKKGEQSKIIIDAPKSQKSVRAIPISNKLYELLKPLKAKNSDENFFLTGEAEKYIEPRNYQYMFKRILKENKMKKYKFHALRHTFASECIDVGMNVKALSEILGHASVDVTLNIYVHSSIKQKRKYLEKL